mmetsp:Transcript_13968/g.21745  ORF Transcript_13968/g.21745 Transcript_13968/m.21745 type:complete len:374 (-) Transcript_13968:295-1416(-)
MYKTLVPLAALVAVGEAFAFSPSALPAMGRATGRTSALALSMNDDPVLRLGTRGSPLALAQAYETRRRLAEAFPEELGKDGEKVQINIINTSGDMRLDKALAEIGGKGLFTKELDVALLGDEVDFCVHSMKDVPTFLPDNTHLETMLPREDTRDAFICPKYDKIEDMPEGTVVGSASLRRQAQLLAKNPGLKVINFRGNVQTRLRKLDDEVVDATLLAMAGLIRMDMTDCVTKTLEWDEMLPAVAQGAIGIQVKSDDEKTIKYISALNHDETKICVECERSFLATLDGSCKTPIAGQAKIIDGKIHFRGLVSSPDGSKVFRAENVGEIKDHLEIGRSAGTQIREEAGEQFFADLMEYVQDIQAANTKPTKASA